MRFCGEKFNAFKEKVSPPPQEQAKRVRHKPLEEDDVTELQGYLSSGGSLASSAPQSQALIPHIDLKKHTIALFLDKLRENRPFSHNLVYQASVGNKFYLAAKQTYLKGIVACQFRSDVAIDQG
jgi:hypothetical protein